MDNQIFYMGDKEYRIIHRNGQHNIYECFGDFNIVFSGSYYECINTAEEMKKDFLLYGYTDVGVYGKTL